MSYKNSALWRAAFEDAREDATSDEQVHLAGRYEAMRGRASALVAKIASDLPHMTVHDVTHLDALWEMGSIACGDKVDLNPAEAFVFGGAVLLHDAAMCLAAFPGGVSELKQQVEWLDLHARYSASISLGDVAGMAEAERRATEDSLRLLHAKQAENLPMISWIGPHDQPMFIIEDQQVRNFYGPKIGKIAYSHWWSIAKVDEELSTTLGALPGVTSCTVDLLKVACLLRVADAMHLDQRRAPAFEFALTKPGGISADHWKFQERMAKPFVRGDALVYTAQPPFGVDIAEAWWTAFDALQMVDRELRDVDRVLHDRQKKALLVRRVEGVHSPRDLARSVETVGWTPVDSTIRVSDVPNIVATLGGSKLYGNSTAAPIRELIQNGLDAITARRKMQSRPPKWGELHIRLEKREDGHWLSFEDNGVGMSLPVLTGPLIDFGKSFWRSSLAIEEFPGLASIGMKPRGKYGIGFFSVFMLGDQVRVVTRRYDRDTQSAKILEFRHGLGSRPNLRDADSKEVPIDGGTRVEVRLKVNPTESGGLLYRKDYFTETVAKLGDVIAAIAPACDVAIKVFQDDKLVGATEAGDWLDIETVALLERIAGGQSSPVNFAGGEELAELRDEEGRLYGRARIEADNEWLKSGLLTVDGLAASKIGLIAGILIGVETTASRNAAEPIVPASVLAAWSSEQGIAIAESEVSDEEKAKGAAIVLACGGDIGDLPIILWQDKWMTSTDFVAAVKDLDRFVLHDGSISHEDDDDVTKRDFEAFFKPDAKIARTVSGRHGRPGSNDWIASVTHGKGSTPAHAVEKLILGVWDDYGSDDDAVVVGEANGSEIYRSVTIFTRSYPASDEDV